MRIVVTGASGNLGTALLRALGDRGADEVVGVARRAPDHPSEGVKWVEADIGSSDLLPVFEGADAVVNLAWTFQPTHDPFATWQTNVRGGTRVADAAVEAGASVLVHASSIGAYRPDPEHRPVREDWPTDAIPTAAYGREKSYLERVLDTVEARHPQMRVVRLRPAFVFQRAAASAQRRIFAGPLLPRRLLRLRPPVVPVPAGLHVQAVHADDVAAACVQVLQRDVRGAFNLAAEPVLGPAELAAALGGRPVEVPMAAVRGALALGWHARLVPASPHLLDLVAGLPLLDSTRAHVELDWRPSVTATEALGEVLHGLRHGEHGDTPALSADEPWRVDELRTGVGTRSIPDDRPG